MGVSLLRLSSYSTLMPPNYNMGQCLPACGAVTNRPMSTKLASPIPFRPLNQGNGFGFVSGLKYRVGSRSKKKVTGGSSWNFYHSLTLAVLRLATNLVSIEYVVLMQGFFFHDLKPLCELCPKLQCDWSQFLTTGVHLYSVKLTQFRYRSLSSCGCRIFFPSLLHFISYFYGVKS